MERTVNRRNNLERALANQVARGAIDTTEKDSFERREQLLSKIIDDLRIKVDAMHQEQISLRAGLDKVMDFLEGDESVTDLTCDSEDDE